MRSRPLTRSGFLPSLHPTSSTTQTLSTISRTYALLRPTDLHRVLRSDQARRSHGDSSRIGASGMPFLHGVELWMLVRAGERRGEPCYWVRKTREGELTTPCHQGRPSANALATTSSGSSGDVPVAPKPKARRKSFAHTEKQVVTTGKLFSPFPTFDPRTNPTFLPPRRPDPSRLGISARSDSRHCRPPCEPPHRLPPGRRPPHPCWNHVGPLGRRSERHDEHDGSSSGICCPSCCCVGSDGEWEGGTTSDEETERADDAVPREYRHGRRTGPRGDDDSGGDAAQFGRGRGEAEEGARGGRQARGEW